MMSKLLLPFLLLVACWTNVVDAFSPLRSPRIQQQQQPLRYDIAVRMSSEGKKGSFPDLQDISKTFAEKFSKLDVGQVASNLQSGGEIGTRGEIYVVGQFALIFFILIGGIPIVGESLRIVAGPTLLLGGALLVTLSLIDLGTDSLTPFLTPTEQGSFKTQGIYATMRHPMYAGLVTLMGGLSILTNSADRLLLTVALYALVNVKASKEEEYMKEKYPAYSEYMEKVPGKLLPENLMDSLKNLIGKKE